jgi:lia operon protein LiaF
MSNRKIVMGLILVLIGFVLLGRTLDLFYFSVQDLIGFFFPLLLIGAGLWVLAHRRGQMKSTEAGYEVNISDDSVHISTPEAQVHVGPTPVPPQSESTTGSTRTSQAPESDNSGRARYSKFIGDLFIDCSGINLQNVEIGNFLGDVEVKLHGGKLAPGLNRMIISGFIGDVRVLVPEGMAIFAQSSNFIGDIEMMGRRSSGFGNSLEAQSANYSEAEAKLYIASNHFIGDVRVYIV